MSIKTTLTWAAIAFLIWWIIQQPESAEHLVQNAGD